MLSVKIHHRTNASKAGSVHAVARREGAAPGPPRSAHAFAGHDQAAAATARHAKEAAGQARAAGPASAKPPTSSVTAPVSFSSTAQTDTQPISPAGDPVRRRPPPPAREPPARVAPPPPVCGAIDARGSAQVSSAALAALAADLAAERRRGGGASGALRTLVMHTDAPVGLGWRPEDDFARVTRACAEVARFAHCDLGPSERSNLISALSETLFALCATDMAPDARCECSIPVLRACALLAPAAVADDGASGAGAWRAAALTEAAERLCAGSFVASPARLRSALALLCARLQVDDEAQTRAAQHLIVANCPCIVKCILSCPEAVPCDWALAAACYLLAAHAPSCDAPRRSKVEAAVLRACAGFASDIRVLGDPVPATLSLRAAIQVLGRPAARAPALRAPLLRQTGTVLRQCFASCDRDDQDNVPMDDDAHATLAQSAFEALEYLFADDAFAALAKWLGESWAASWADSLLKDLASPQALSLARRMRCSAALWRSVIALVDASAVAGAAPRATEASLAVRDAAAFFCAEARALRTPPSGTETPEDALCERVEAARFAVRFFDSPAEAALQARGAHRAVEADSFAWLSARKALERLAADLSAVGGASVYGEAETEARGALARLAPAQAPRPAAVSPGRRYAAAVSAALPTKPPVSAKRRTETTSVASRNRFECIGDQED